MYKLPENLNIHPFFMQIQQDMKENILFYKKKLNDFSLLPNNEKKIIVLELSKLGFIWPDILRQEGFWCRPEEKDFLFKINPYPQKNQINANDISDFISTLIYVQNKSNTLGYMGTSNCRICGKKNGNKTYYTDLFAWPEGYQHYIEEHGVQPSAAFVLHIRNLI